MFAGNAAFARLLGGLFLPNFLPARCAEFHRLKSFANNLSTSARGTGSGRKPISRAVSLISCTTPFVEQTRLTKKLNELHISRWKSRLTCRRTPLKKFPSRAEDKGASPRRSENKLFAVKTVKNIGHSGVKAQAVTLAPEIVAAANVRHGKARFGSAV